MLFRSIFARQKLKILYCIGYTDDQNEFSQYILKFPVSSEEILYLDNLSVWKTKVILPDRT